jgi:glycosyltransferase involved in cell wall biosynthesis
MAARAARRPHLIHQHTLPHLSSARAAGAGQRGLYRSLLRDRQYIAVAPHVRAGLLKLGVEPGHIEIVPNGVPIPEQVPPPHSGPIGVGVLGRFDPGKGMLTFIEAATRTGLGPDRATFVIGGSGGPFADHESEVRTAAEQAGVAIVEPGGDGVGFLADLDVVVIPSRYEGSPLTLLEAMALGRAVVGSDIPGIRVHVGPDGALFAAPDHAEGFAERIRQLVEDGGLRRMMGQAARATAIERFDVRTMQDRALAVIDDVAAPRD